LKLGDLFLRVEHVSSPLIVIGHAQSGPHAIYAWGVPKIWFKA
jgi:hypothetical protein